MLPLQDSLCCSTLLRVTRCKIWPRDQFPMDTPYARTKIQLSTSDTPHSSIKKLIVSTPRLLRNLHMMSLAKAVLNGVKDPKCRKIAICKCPPIPYFPEKHCVQETSLPSGMTISRRRLVKVQSYELLSGNLVCARHSSSMWDLPLKQWREGDSSRPRWNLTRCTQNNAVGSSRQ